MAEPEVTQRAIDEIRRLAEKEIELVGKRWKAVHALAAAEQGAGLAYLEGKNSGLDQVIKLRAELGVIDAAVRTCQAQRSSAVKNRYSIEAKEARRKITEKQAEIASLNAKTAKHLQALSELEGVAYTHEVLGCQPAGEGALRAHIEPRSETLRREISELDRSAQEAENWRAPNYGTVDMPDVINEQEFSLAVLMHDSQGVTAQVLVDWIDACHTIIKKKNLELGDKPRRYRLAWREGKVDPESYVHVKALARVIPGDLGPDSYDSESATFRPKAEKTQAA
jgi:hypothetical protein